MLLVLLMLTLQNWRVFSIIIWIIIIIIIITIMLLCMGMEYFL